MVREYKNPVREGLPSKIYFLAYGKKISGYGIAKRIYGKKYPPTAKTYGWLNILSAKKIVKKRKKGYISNAKPLLAEIEKLLEKNTNTKLSNFEKEIVLSIIDSQEFRTYVESFYEIEDLSSDFDAVKELVYMLCIVLSGVLIPKVMIHKKIIEPKNIEEFHESLIQFRKKYKQNLVSKRNIKTTKKDMGKLKNAVTNLMNVPEISILDKNNITKLIDFNKFGIFFISFAIPTEILLHLTDLSMQQKQMAYFTFNIMQQKNILSELGITLNKKFDKEVGD